MMDVLSGFPPEWRCTVVVNRSGGRDVKGNPLPEVSRDVPGCLVAGESSSELTGSRSDAPSTTAWVYAPVGSDFLSTDSVMVPPGPWPSGRFQVDGEPKPSPLGTVVPLRRL